METSGNPWNTCGSNTWNTVDGVIGEKREKIVQAV